MRLSSVFVGLGVAALANAATPPASVYILDSDHPSPSNEPPSLTPAEVQLLISQRLGVSNGHELSHVHESTIQHINAFGSQQELLLDYHEKVAKVGRLLVLVDGVDDVEEYISASKRSPSLFMSHPPPPSMNEDLARAYGRALNEETTAPMCIKEVFGKSYFGQICHYPALHHECCPALRSPSTAFEDVLHSADVLNLNPDLWCGESMTAVVYVNALKRLAEDAGQDDDASTGSGYALPKAITALIDNNSASQETIIVLFPTTATHAKRSTSPYSDLSVSALTASSRRHPIEEPLEVSPVSDSEPDQSPISSPHEPAETTFPPLPKGIIAPCHASFNACVAATRNCSGHGSCYQKYETKPLEGKAPRKCFSCACAPSRVDTGVPGTIKTINWGGAACQKKDVSVPFFLLLGIALFLGGGVAYAIGLLVSVGQEELPGVIGAGVSGPKAR